MVLVLLRELSTTELGGKPLQKSDLCVTAWMESELVTTYCLNTGIQNICTVFQKLKILISPLP